MEGGKAKVALLSLLASLHCQVHYISLLAKPPHKRLNKRSKRAENRVQTAAGASAWPSELPPAPKCPRAASQGATGALQGIRRGAEGHGMQQATGEECKEVGGLAPSLLTCLANTAMSSLKDSEEHTSPPATPGSRGVHVANSHFSKIRAKRGKRGCLQEKKHTQKTVTPKQQAGFGHHPPMGRWGRAPQTNGMRAHARPHQAQGPGLQRTRLEQSSA